jgi:transcriptional regulator with GAF, ATPase, and Fis domain
LADYFPQIKDAGKILSDKPLDLDLPFNISPLGKLSSNNKLDEDSYGLIGNAPEFRKVKDQVTLVAPFDISVLILGESGTGKERIAQAIHGLSERKAKPMVKVNCAAIPASLIESELFGHEKGAFTGAFDRRIGKFEQANGGTIFLDEIGELPFELQVKLLCVLQEKEIVRLGGNHVLKTDVRIIAATNRNLEKAVAEGTFRLDLFYRLNVFPISLPLLCNRREDIPELVDHFLNKLSGLVDRDKKKFSPEAMRALMDYDWPGNIRELENIVERSLIVNRANKILEVELPVHHKDDKTGSTLEGKVKTIKELEKEHILEVLKKCNGKVAGTGGAAEMLDLPPNTLVAKIKRLGIVKDYL